jgi:hypothetical protein
MDATVQQLAPADELRELVKPGSHPLDAIDCLRGVAERCDLAHRMIGVACRRRADRIARIFVGPDAPKLPPRLDPEIEEVIRQNIAEAPRPPAASRRAWRY